MIGKEQFSQCFIAFSKKTELMICETVIVTIVKDYQIYHPKIHPTK